MVSIRGFKSALLITEVCTRRKYGFPTRSRSPPLAIFRYFVNHMRKMGFSATQLRVDEDGALARSANFMQMVIEELEMAVGTTGTYNSEANGMVESPIKPIKRMIRAFLIGASLPDEIWCYAFCYAIFVLNHWYNRSIKTMPMVKWYDGKYQLQIKDLIIF